MTPNHVASLLPPPPSPCPSLCGISLSFLKAATFLMRQVEPID